MAGQNQGKNTARSQPAESQLGKSNIGIGLALQRLEAIAKLPEVRQAVPAVEQLTPLLLPALHGNQLVLALDEDNQAVMKWVAALKPTIIAPRREVREPPRALKHDAAVRGLYVRVGRKTKTFMLTIRKVRGGR